MACSSEGVPDSTSEKSVVAVQEESRVTDKLPIQENSGVSSSAGPSKGSSVVFITNHYAQDLERMDAINQLLTMATADADADAGVKCYTTVVDRNEKLFKVDEKTGVTIVYPRERAARLMGRSDMNSWLLHHGSLYSHLEEISDVSAVVSYNMTGDCSDITRAAIDIRSSLFPKAKLIFFNILIPENVNDMQGETDVMRFAEQADIVLSVGPSVFRHFTNKYYALNEPPQHELYMPPLWKAFSNLTFRYPCGHKQVLTVCDMKSEDDFHKYKFAAIAMGKAADVYNAMYSDYITWKMHGVPPNLYEAFKRYLADKTSSHLHVVIQHGKSTRDCQIAIQQSVVLIAPERLESFHLLAYLAMQAGCPVLVPTYTGIVGFLRKLFPSNDYHEYCSVNTAVNENCLDGDVENWKDQILRNLVPSSMDTAFKRAQTLQQELRVHPQLHVTHQDFLRLL